MSNAISNSRLIPCQMSFDSKLKIDFSAVLVFSMTDTLDAFGLVSLMSADCHLILWQELNFLITGKFDCRLVLILVLATRKHSKKKKLTNCKSTKLMLLALF